VVNGFLRVVAWLLAGAIVVLSLVPASYRPITEAPHNVEHLAIFLTAGLAFGLGYPSRRLLQGLALIVFAGAIEVAQLWDPGRHARLGDFVVDALGACAGTILAWLCLRLMRDRIVQY
jgi:VanZ family protein